ncbi:hypothetical protein [Spirosoma endophyticum]|uniref:KOW domain-containing protein n=1 Tax=Spirosoma endophyticum TaxID=662367 RepID=A0A1I2E8L3_9BACT|nr:hypothetical protein [Spirosoma endophyticum]SFE89033.1 hypothetical protein SAMN05216167_12159 [Spirosoma endophyticum]
MNTDINPGDQVKVIQIPKGSFYRGRYQATVIGHTDGKRIRVRNDQGQYYAPYFAQVRTIP